MADAAGFLTLAIIVGGCFLTNKDAFFFFLIDPLNTNTCSHRCAL